MMHGNFAWMAVPGVAMVVAVGVAGCESKLTMDRYQSVKNGMTLDEVQNILGPGEFQAPGQASKIAADLVGGVAAGSKKPESTREVYLWKEDRVEISVVFEKGKVVDKNQAGLR